jgi:hypothetical protein
LSDGTAVRALTPGGESFEPGSEELLYLPVKDCQLVSDFGS